jgi:hypothetical protein
MTEMVVFEDLNHKLYVASRKDYDKILHNHPSLKRKLCELVSVYKSDNYIELHQNLHNNGMFKVVE